MKYMDFKRYKFSTISKEISRIIDNFSRIYKNIKKNQDYIFSRIHRIIKIVINNFSNAFKSINFRRYNLFRIFRTVSLRRYNFSRIYRKLDIRKYKYIPFYGAAFVIFSIFIYINIPLFFSYDKSKIENIICKDLNIQCSIQGKIKYSFFPSPRIKFNDFIIKDFSDKKKTLGTVKNGAVKISFYNLLEKKNFNFTKIQLRNTVINLDLNELKKYKDFFKKKFNSKPIDLQKGELNFLDGKKSIATIRNVNLKYKSKKNGDDIILKGIFFDNNIYINLKNKENEDSKSKIFTLKFLDLRTKINIFNSDPNKKTMDGNISIKKNKNRLTAIFDYKDGQIIIKHANLRNAFLDGKSNGIVKFLPYFNFDLNVDLNAVNFNRLHSTLVALDENSKKKLFKVNRKINGQLNLSADKIFSKRTLIDSFESRLKFVNGNILIEQLLLNLGKTGAADIIGIIENDEKFSNFKFEHNIFLDNMKRFYNNFGIYNKQNTATNLFASGSFDLINLTLRLNEISKDKKFKNEDVAYIEKEFNNILLEDGYVSLFNYASLKEFIQLIVDESN